MIRFNDILFYGLLAQ